MCLPGWVPGAVGGKVPSSSQRKRRSVEKSAPGCPCKVFLGVLDYALLFLISSAGDHTQSFTPEYFMTHFRAGTGIRWLKLKKFKGIQSGRSIFPSSSPHCGQPVSSTQNALVSLRVPGPCARQVNKIHEKGPGGAQGSFSLWT